MSKLNVWFDKEGDFLEISSSNKKGSFRDLGNGIFERVDTKGKIIGFAVMNVKKREKKSVPVPINASFTKALV